MHCRRRISNRHALTVKRVAASKRQGATLYDFSGRLNESRHERMINLEYENTLLTRILTETETELAWLRRLVDMS